MAQKQTTGTTISRLGVLTVLTMNLAEVDELTDGARARFEGQRDAILAGSSGVSKKKVAVRSLQRCVAGGALMTVGRVGIWGAN